MQHWNSTLKLRSKVLIRAIRPHIFHSAKVLDIGCGNAFIANEVRQTFSCKLTGTDVLAYLSYDIPFKLMSAPDRLDFRTKEFDFGLIVDTLHHVEFDTQINVIKESLRVCRTVLVFEVAPTWLAKKLDIGLNKIHNPKMNLCLSHRHRTDWLEFFNENEIPCQFYQVKKPFLGYPFENYLFVLEATDSMPAKQHAIV